MTLLGDYIKNDNVFKAATYMALFISVLTVANNLGISIPSVTKLPLASLGFNWVVPVIIAAIIGNFIPNTEEQNNNKLDEAS